MFPKRYKLAVFAILIAAGTSQPTFAQSPVQVCDILAASPYDTTRPEGVPGVESDAVKAKEAEQACRAAWEQTKEPRMAYQLARALYESGNLEEAMTLFSEAEKGGHVAAKVGKAQSMLDMARAKAVEMLKEAADSGSANALYNLGVKAIDGEGMPQDTAKGISFYEKASAMGDAWAIYNLGVLYDEGELVLRDAAKAKSYYEQAVAKGHSWAKINLGYLLLEGKVEEAERKQALELFRSAATDDDDINAGLQLGIMLQNGTPSEQDESEALVLAALKARDTELGTFLQQTDTGLSERNLKAIKAEMGVGDGTHNMDETAIAALRRFYE